MRAKLPALAIGAALFAAPLPPASAQNVTGVSVNWRAALSNTAVAVKGSPGTVTWVSCYNSNATAAFVQFFDLTTAVTPGTTVPRFSLTINQGNQFFPINVRFLNGVQVLAASTATGGSAPAATQNCSFGFL